MIMKIIVIITDGKKTYSEDVTEDQEEYFKEIDNGINPDVILFEQWTRELKPFPFTTIEISKYNTINENCHFIYGWAECFSQADDIPGWMFNENTELTILVKHEFAPKKTGELCNFDCCEQGMKECDCENCACTHSF